MKGSAETSGPLLTACAALFVAEVTLHGVPATIVSQTDSQVVVTTGSIPAGSVGTGNVCVRSASRGETVLPAGFTYEPGTAATTTLHRTSDGMPSELTDG